MYNSVPNLHFSNLVSEIYRSFFAKAKIIWRKHNKSIPSADEIKELLGKYLRTPSLTRWNR